MNAAGEMRNRYNRRVASLAVLADERPGWRPSSFGYGLWGTEVGFRFATVKLLDWAGHEAALEQNANPFAALVLAHLKTQQRRQDPESRRAWKMRIVRSLYERGWAANDVRRMFGFIDWLMDLPPELGKQFIKELHSFEQEKQMPYVTSVERFAIERGRQEGLVVGRKEGEREGLLAGIQSCLRIRFGPAGLTLEPAVQQVQDADSLRSLLARIETAGSLDEVRTFFAGEATGTPPSP